MGNQSKPYLSLFEAIPYTCYEVGHTWNPSCFASFLRAFRTSFIYGLKLMIPFYGVDLVIKSFKHEIQLTNEIFNFFRSCLFVATNGACVIGGFCFLRHLIGKFYGWHSFVVAVIIGYICLNIERKSRRKMVAMYLLPAALEIVYGMAVSRNYFKPIANGEVLLFCLASSGIANLYRTHQLPGYIRNILTFFVSTEEEEGLPLNRKSSWTLMGKSFINNSFKTLLQRLNLNELKHSSCPHKFSCIHYTLEGFSSSFLFGLLTDLILHYYRKKSFIGISKSLQLPYFLSCYITLFRVSNCCLRWARNKDSPSVHGAVSGAVAGLASFLYRSSTISLYMTIKLLEILLTNPANAKYVPRVKYAEFHLYALSLGFILHAAYLEPHSIRPKLWKLFCNFSGNNFQQMFRKLLDVYGTNASKLYPDFVPKLEKQFVKSAAVKEILIANGKWY